MDAGLDPRTPVIVGVGQFCERIGTPGYRELSAVDIAAQAARRACDDALGLAALRPWIDAIATTRTFDDSRHATPAFGTSRNFPRSVAQRLGIEPAVAVWESVGGDTPQKLVAHIGERIARGDLRMALLAGGEAISTVRHLQKQGRRLDWNEAPAGSVEDHGKGIDGLVSPYNQRHGLIGAPLSYALLENARRHARGRTRAQYALDMAELFAPFTAIAAANPFSAFAQVPQTAAALAADTPRNRMIADPYRLSLVAKDQVNQGAALLMTSIDLARELGIPPELWCFLHGHAELAEHEIMAREDLGESPAARVATRAAFERAGVSVADCAHFDFYSCFPIAVSNVACDELGLAPDDPRGLTVTGGLPFFGGPGNNYSMHAIAAMVSRLRADPGAFGFVGANGGYLSKYAAGLYACRPIAWPSPCSSALQAEIDALPSPPLAESPHGMATIESYTVAYESGVPVRAIVAARLGGTNARLLAVTAPGSSDLQALLGNEPIGRSIDVHEVDGVNRFHMTECS